MKLKQTKPMARSQWKFVAHRTWVHMTSIGGVLTFEFGG